MQSEKMSGARLGFGLLCALAVCCSVMYITADGEHVLQTTAHALVAKGPTSVDSEDVQKAGTIFTNTPDGRMRLVDYFTNVEKEIAAEEAARKKDVEEVKATMARNFAFNQAARAKMKKALLAKMAANAKEAHEHLERSMATVQKKFAEAAALENKRFKASQEKSKKMRAHIAADKAAAHKQLETAVTAQQKAMATVADAVNARIAKTDKNVAKNAENIKNNAKKAQQALEKATSKFDKKLNNAKAEAAAGRSKLATQLATQQKDLRQYAANKMKVVAAKTAAAFRRVELKMAADRKHADEALQLASTRMSASMNAMTALNKKRFNKTVKDLAAAKADAKAKVEKAESEYKARIRLLKATVKNQVGKSKARIAHLTGVVESNKATQARINSNVNAEIGRMNKLGADRYKEHLKKDKELKHMLDSNKAAVDARIKAMSAHFSMELNKVEATMKKNRAHASKELASHTAALYSAISKSEEAQLATNKKLAHQTELAKMNIEDALRAAKKDFGSRMGALHSTIVKNDKKFEKKMDKLTGIVRADAMKNAKGRKELAQTMKANKEELSAAVNDAIHKGEVRMMKAEKKLTTMNAKTKAALNGRITVQITKQAKRAASQIEGLRLQSKEARAAMRKEMLEGVRDMADEAKKNLDSAVEKAKEDFAKANDKEIKRAKANKAERGKIAEEIAKEKKITSEALKDAVSTMEKTLLALKSETRKKIKKTNKAVDAYGKAVEKEAKDVKALMSSNMKMLTQKISNAEDTAKKAIAAANSASAAGYKAALVTVKAELKAAEVKSNKKFADFYEKMGKNREELETALGASVANINDSIAKQAALADARFSKTVKDIKAARKEAATQVADARKDFATAMVSLTASVKDQETRLNGDIQTVASLELSRKADQIRVNRRVKAELGRVMGLVNDRTTKNAKARGKIRALLNENKRAAHEEVKALEGLFENKIGKIRSKAAANSIEAAKDLTAATKSMYNVLSEVQLKAMYENKLSAAAIKKYEAEAAGQIADVTKSFGTKLNQLTNVVASNAKKVEHGFEVLTGVIRDEKKAAKEDRELIKKQTTAMKQDMQKRIARAIQLGETQAKRVAEDARQSLSGMKKAMLIEISEKVESKADELFASIQGNHQKLADNYLSLKAYAVVSKGALRNYVTKGKGKNLSSLGDLLMTIGALSSVKEPKAEGVGFGTDSIPAVFTGDSILLHDKGVSSKINGLVNEYTDVTNAVRMRWPMGLGKYLLSKLEESMLEKGVLQVDKVEGKSGNFVFINGHAVGLSNKLNDFESLAVRMNKYEAGLAKLTASLSGKIKHTIVKKKLAEIKPPEWQGD
jgi:hypothetical protein